MKRLRPGRMILGLTSVGVVFGMAACDAPKPKGSRLSGEGNVLPAHCDQYYETEDEADASASFRLAAATDAVYDSQVKGIINTKCAYAGCHVAGANIGDLTSYTYFEDADQKASFKARVVTTPNMPPATAAATGGPLDATEKDLLTTFITNGYPKVYVAPVDDPKKENPPAATAVTYTQIAALMTEQGCNSCHSTAAKSGNTILDTEAGYKEKAAKVPTKLASDHFGKTFSAEQLKLTSDYAATLAAPKPDEGKKGDDKKATGDDEIPEECLLPEDKPKSGDPVDGDPKLEKVLKPAKLTECHDKSLMYDRRTKDCNAATLGGDYECNWTGVKAKFKNIAPEKTLLDLEAGKWQVDQCGVLEGDPLVFLVKIEASDDVIDLQVKQLSVERE